MTRSGTATTTRVLRRRPGSGSVAHFSACPSLGRAPGEMGRIRVGISGWTYAGWRGDFYPKGLVQRRELEYAADRLTRSRSTAPSTRSNDPTYAGWRAQTPDDFVFAVKGGRFITHMKKLRDVETALANFFASGVLPSGGSWGPCCGSCRPTWPSTRSGCRTSSTCCRAPPRPRPSWRSTTTTRCPTTER